MLSYTFDNKCKGNQTIHARLQLVVKKQQWPFIACKSKYKVYGLNAFLSRKKNNIQNLKTKVKKCTWNQNCIGLSHVEVIEVSVWAL